MLRVSVRELAAKAGVSVDTVTRLEYGGALMPRTLAAVQQALEAAGIEFLPEDGVRLPP
jgi:transcriptional regulator with XRE-family HTH domain